MSRSVRTITGLKDPTFAFVRGLCRPEGRLQARAFVVEGDEIVAQALAASAPPQTVLLSDALPPARAAELAELAANRGVNCCQISRGLLTKLTGAGYETAVEALAVVPRMPVRLEELDLTGEALVLVCERIQDPRNVGVLIRTADALGLRGVIFTADSADPYSRAAVRSTTGSILRVPLVLAEDIRASVAALRAACVRLLSTSAHARDCLWEVNLSGACAIIVGNERTGVSPALRAMADVEARIPMFGGASSFNVTVAAGIALYEHVRQPISGR